MSLLLILVFSQKLGMELWVHDWLHESKATHSLLSRGSGSAGEKGSAGLQQQSFKCHCLEDVFVPLIESDLPVYRCPATHLVAVFLTGYSSYLSGDREFSSLRGPPAASHLL